jgi:putative ABC transport system ATP-binding protein
MPISASEPIIRAHQVHKTFRTGKIEVHALRGVDLVVNAGAMIAVMGPSGCGKTTMLNCISGLDSFDEGEIFIEGVDLSKMSDRVRTDYRARRMGFIFQTFNLLPVITAVENVELPLLVTGVRPAPARKRALEVLDQVGLADRAGHRPAELSGGQRQRVTIARALVNNPAIVWADEPTGNLDSKSAGDVLSLMRQLNRERGQTLVIVTHDAAIGALCDNIVQMQDGTIVEQSNTVTQGHGDGSG